MWFAYRHQPLQAFYWIYAVGALLFVRLPFWLVRYSFPSQRPRKSWGIGRSIFIDAMRAFLDTALNASIPAGPTAEKAAKSADSLGFVWVDAKPELVVGEIQELALLNGVQAEKTSGYWYGEKGVDGKVGQRAGPDEKVLYELHSGGYIMGSASPKDIATPSICLGLLKHCPQLSRSFAVEYRLSSGPPFKAANPFPAALIDAVAGYDYLINTLGFRPENVIVSGDSAGGNLAPALARYLVTARLPNLPPPIALLLLSPTVDWGCTHGGPDSSWVRNARTDMCQGIFDSGYSIGALLGNMPASAAYTNPWISPASQKLESTQGMFTGFPKTCIVSGEAEIALDSMRTLNSRFVADLGKDKVTYIEVQDATHDFIALTIHEPERTNALRDVAAWVESLWLDAKK